MQTEPVTYADWSDACRVYVAVMAVWLCVLFARLAIQRAIRYGIGIGINPHPLTSVGIMIVLAAAASGHYASFGAEGTWRLWLLAVGYTVLMVGMVMAIRWRRPSLRNGDQRDRQDATHPDEHP